MNLSEALGSREGDVNIGMIVEGNVYIGDFAHYLAMSASELDTRISYLQALRRRTFSRFIRHRTVPWFGSCLMVLAIGILANPSHKPSMALGVLTIAWAVFGVLPPLIWMNRERRDLFNALTLLRREILTAKAARATK